MLRIVDKSTVVEVMALADCAPDLSLLPQEDRDRHSRFVNRQAADSYLRRQSTLRRRLGKELGLDPREVQLSTVANQKPVIDLPGPPLHFNLSSSGPLMALAFDRRVPVGTDIECHEIHRGLAASSLAPALHPAELKQLAANDLEDILQCWVFKEAWIKWTGEGMRADLKALRLWRPGLADSFIHDGAEVRLSRVEVEGGQNGTAAWVGLVRSATGSTERGL